MITKKVTAMYDNLNITLLNQEYPDVDFVEETSQYLTSVAVNGESNQGPFVNGYLGAFKVSINPNRIKLHGASLGRFIHGDNQQGMSLQATRRAIHKLSDQLHLDVGRGKVTRLDVGRNISTRYTSDTYMPFLGESTGYRRLEAGVGLYYKNSLRTLCFYDKIREQKEKRHEIQPIFRGHNLLRYELRMMKNLDRELGRRITASLLTDEGFYIQLGRLWRDQYLKISKRANKAGLINPTSSTRDLMVQLAARSIQEIGDEALLGQVSQWQQQGLLMKKQACDHRKFIREAVRREMREQGNELMDELTRKIKQATRYFI